MPCCSQLVLKAELQGVIEKVVKLTLNKRKLLYLEAFDNQEPAYLPKGVTAFCCKSPSESTTFDCPETSHNSPTASQKTLVRINPLP